MEKELKNQIINDYKTSENDTGSAEVHVALLTQESTTLTNTLRQTKMITTQDVVL